MLRHGILTRGQFRATRNRRFRWPWSPVSLSLGILSELEATWDGGDEDLLELLYDSLVASNGVCKITRRNRFLELDQRLAREILDRADASIAVSIHDVGVSSGITALELHQQLRSGCAARVLATDLFDALLLVRPRNHSWTVVFDTTRRALQFIGHGFAISVSGSERPWLPVNRVLQAWLMRSLLPRAVDVLNAARSEPERLVPTELGTVTPIRLFHPEAIALSQRDSTFVLGRHDLFATMPEQFDVVRAMNVLNPCYFVPPLLLAGLRACAEGVRPNGLLVVGRSLEETDRHTRATAFRRQGDRLVHAWDVNEGTELREQILSLRLPPGEKSSQL